MRPIKMGSALLTVVLLYVIATFGSIVSFGVLGDGLDVLGVAMLLPLFIMPALACFVLPRVWQVRPSYRHLLFWLMFVPVPLLLLVLALRDYFVPAGEAHGLAILLAIPLLVGGLIAYGTAAVWDSTE